MMDRSRFRAEADAYIDAHPDQRWEWREHPSGLGYMAREVEHIRREQLTAPETLTCKQYVCYSATFQVPTFYFTLHDASGSPLAVTDLVGTTLFSRNAFEGTQQTSFAVSQPDSAFPLLSQGDHPTLGTPCWYFHPCQTAAAVDEIMKALGHGEQGLGLWVEKWFVVLGSVVNT
ncbi:hypothetical protein FB45DRAFT_903703 [Roridomyces roridus]|uniref:Ubiquitin-like-conjugating enzyme ATG10 n=1 Tax=Roridomyces roridus TaxID=1738132 RepID=A0AAD7C6C3_9AGAR|nr:hypothetical protein FB45DRAFT_903703 [Roridomyces roridus]